MTHAIRKVAVIGAGTMGAAIAAHAANAGLHVVLLDAPPATLTPDEQARGLALDARAVRNRLVQAGFERMRKARPAALFTADLAQRITLGNTADDIGLIADADWIVEAIVEQIEPKRALMQQIEQVRRPGSIISSNTSGIPIAALAEGRSPEFRQHFLGSHFFNPPRYLYLLELIPTPDTLPEVVAQFRAFAEDVLGKGVVLANDRPNFIANRIGSYLGQVRLRYALERGYSVEEVDNLTGPLIGNPKTATFRLVDLVGLDVSAHVNENLHQAAPEDEEREVFATPDLVHAMLERKLLGNKAGGGFYKQHRSERGKEFWPLNLQTLEYQPPTKVRFDLVGKARKIDDLGERMRFLMANAAGDRAGEFIRDTTLRTLAYAARRIPEISESLADVDSAMRWGFGVRQGPFELWDTLGLRATADQMRQLGIALAPWVEALLEQGGESLYRREGGRATAVYSPAHRAYEPLPHDARVIELATLRAQGHELAANESASVLDLGDGVLCFEFHSKMNSLDPLIVEMGFRALELLGDPAYVGMVVGNQAENFCVGANISMVGMSAMAGQVDALRELVTSNQRLMQALRFAPKPVVAAPYGRVLGGGAEVAMAAARRVAAAESYIGQVELGVGLIPAAGGCKELLRRVLTPVMQASEQVDPLPLFQQVFETIALAKVSESAEQARAMGFLVQGDRVVMNREHLIGEAKREVLRMAAEGYAPPAPAPIYAVGRRAVAAAASNIHQMVVAGYISEYDQKLATALTWVLAGGDFTSPQWVTEQYILDMEVESFMRLACEPRTLERIMAMLQNGKPLRN
ncbi:3-hydroxyacyl-CoA dehydrogenase/enoyl-CoA hydratase family protein [Chloroflexia bacterium SDU3-3]|nr:3-hydroxyacyl-CoA dehydrogenase/enoyl-CoA hydratase family protein [Chloroflexia bacterium SDU3-3]